MSNELQMSLRKKKNFYSYRNQEINDLDEYQDYHRPINKKDVNIYSIKSTPYAKLLTKFINQINENCRQNKKQINKQKEKKQVINEQKPVSQVKKKVKMQPTNPQLNLNTNNKKISPQVQQEKNPQKNQQPPKKYNKQLYRFKDQHNQNNLKNLIPQVNQIKPPKPTTSYNLNQLANNGIPNFEILSNYLMSLNNPHFNQSFDNPTLFLQSQFGQKLPPYNFTEFNNNPIFNQQLIINKNLPEKTLQKKLFKRSAFHVAIAYHIHLKNIQQKRKDLIDKNASEIDPTYFARKLRQKKQDPQQEHSVGQK